MTIPPAPVRPGGDRLGRHRVLAPPGALPQAATRLDASLPIYDDELLLDVGTLNIDSASFRQMRAAAGGDLSRVAAQVLRNVAAAGKQQNPVTGSGGMLLGTVRQVGPRYANRSGLTPGERVCTLVSLTLTPLALDRVVAVRETEQLDVEGRAIVFDSGPIARLPDDVDLRVCLALLDVAGAPARARTLVAPGDTVVILGAGKSAVLSAAAIRRAHGDAPRILVGDHHPPAVTAFAALGLADDCFVVDALDASAVLDAVAGRTGGRMADLCINTANVEGTELAAVLACRQGGRVYFFNMATSFQKAALGAEGVGMDVELLIGNGYAPGHADLALDLYRRAPTVRRWFDERFRKE